jgi:23S rRNA pseudouridine2605 synthase
VNIKQEKSKDELVRLNKFIANSGICSRREADEYITAGLISVNGQIITELGTKIKRDDDVRFNKERLKGENKAYVLLNKPKNYITTTDDPHAKKTVMELIEGACKERVYPVGRLDRNSTGVLLFTNDGDLAKQLTHPSNNKLKVYQVRIDKNVTKADLKALTEGIELEDGLAVADNIHVSDTNKAELGVEIHSGKNRVIRRMFEKLGYEVVKLDRVYFAGLTKKGLRRGQYRLLTTKEVEMLKMGAYE